MPPSQQKRERSELPPVVERHIMARTYIPTTVIEVHKQAKFMSSHQTVLRAAIVAVDPSYGALFDSLLAALLAFDAVANVLYPLED